MSETISFLTFFFVFLSLAHSEIPPLGISRTLQLNAGNGQKQHDTTTHPGVEMFNFKQETDHFTFTPESFRTFQQRYAVDSTHWAGGNAPILAYLGAESAFDGEISELGFLRENGPRLNALVIYIEHRYYGQSMPFGSAKESLKNASTLGYLTAAQALADYAAILLHVKEKYSAPYSPIVVVGGSYGGMLAAWFRLKYPHIAMGALASSAPVLYFQDTRPKHGYFYIVTKDFKETSERCYETIRDSWREIDRIGAKPNGLKILSKKFRSCSSLMGTSDLKSYLITMYAVAAQYNRFSSSSSDVIDICKAINKARAKKMDILSQIFAGFVASRGNLSCYDVTSPNHPDNVIAWSWQSCTEMVMPLGQEKEDSMFQPEPFNMSHRIETCKSTYGVPPRPHWATTYFGIQDIKLILQRFGSNIIFSNGLMDPYSVGGVLEDISPSVVALTTRHGSHCQDIVVKSEDDPEWLLLQREKEYQIIESWIATYYRDLRNLNISM